MSKRPRTPHWLDDRQLDNRYLLRRRRQVEAELRHPAGPAPAPLPAPPRPAQLRVARVVHLTPRAVLVETVQARRYWLPKSHIRSPAPHLVVYGWEGVLKLKDLTP